MLTRLVLRAAMLTALIGCALAGPAQADTPPAPTCFYYLAGCDGTYGTVSNSTLQTVAVDETVTVGAPQTPNPAFGVPFPEGCVPDEFHICLYSNVAWKFSIPVGLPNAPVTVVDGCTSSSTTCKFTYRPRGIGAEGDFWQTLVAANQIGATNIQAKKGYGFYARPKWRWVQFTSSGATNWVAGTAYAVRSGTTPTWGSCVDASTIVATTATTADCIKGTGTLTAGKDPQWRMPLPANSSWKVLFNPFQRSEAGPAAIPPAQENWVAQSITVGESDITRNVTPRARGTLTATLDVGGPTILLGQSRTVTLKATATGGAVQSAGFEANLFTRTGTSVSISYVNDDAGLSGKTLLPGESVTATGKITANALTPPLTTLKGQAVWRSPTSASSDQKASATADVTVYKDTVPPPPPTGEDSTVPKPPNPASATTGAVTGTVTDGPKTTYRVLWYAAPTCDTEDAGARFVGLRDVTTDDAGNGDASTAFTTGVSSGEAVFGYSTLGGKRSKRSTCVTAAGDPPLSGGGGAGGPIIVTPPKTTAPPKLTLTLVGARFKKGRAGTLKLKVPAAGKVELRRGAKRFAKAVKVKRGVAAFKVRFTKKGKVKLTAVFTPASGGAKTTQPLTITVT